MYLPTPSYSSDKSKLEAAGVRLVCSYEEAREIARGWDIISSAPLKQRKEITDIESDFKWAAFLKTCNNAVQYTHTDGGDGYDSGEEVESIDMKVVLDHCYELAFCIPLSPKGSFDRNSPSLFSKSPTRGQCAKLPTLEL
jgi:hypothetical protein